MAHGCRTEPGPQRPDPASPWLARARVKGRGRDPPDRVKSPRMFMNCTVAHSREQGVYRLSIAGAKKIPIFISDCSKRFKTLLIRLLPVPHQPLQDAPSGEVITGFRQSYPQKLGKSQLQGLMIPHHPIVDHFFHVDREIRSAVLQRERDPENTPLICSACRRRRWV